MATRTTSSPLHESPHYQLHDAARRGRPPLDVRDPAMRGVRSDLHEAGPAARGYGHKRRDFLVVLLIGLGLIALAAVVLVTLF